MADINLNNNTNQNVQGTILSRHPQGIENTNNVLDAEKIYGIGNSDTNQSNASDSSALPGYLTPTMIGTQQQLSNLPAYQAPEVAATANQNYSTTMMSSNNAWQNNVDSGFLNDMGYDYSNVANIIPQNNGNLESLNGFIKTQIGRKVTIDFLIGTTNMVTKSGLLVGAADDYIVINEENTSDITTCDFEDIKFIRFYY